METTVILKTVNLTKKYSGLTPDRIHAVKDLTLEIKKGEVFGFLGRNGAGKTTTIKMICGLLLPTSGEVYINNVEATNPEARRTLGYLPEQPYFYEYLTPRETIDFYGRLKGMTSKERHEEWLRLEELLQLKTISDIRLKNFSKGMRQKIGFAIALVGNPDLLILDEPMSGLDPVGRKHIRELIQQQREFGKTIFFSSHVLSDVEQLCDRVGVLSRGKLVASGNIRDVLQQEIRKVEVVFKSAPTHVISELEYQGILLRKWEDYTHFQFENLQIANDAVFKCISAGGHLVELSPQKETLEDFFIRMQIKEEQQEKRKEIYYSRVEE
ncbi:MAG TPA: ABC transporter ATP-binding protein [Candidatus Hydrogenedens sp.]|nr:ABC transporter ATP-binding protein [Candidatus Hydrogenedens sp.]HOK08324.1 ABC transporter ATP-binding protein [Candidatus Hydrogenedens sp.]HOL18882.1 ABC transporter ATP-binding protein [Candidatus Hydrogenedens sp.]HPP57618.1 ABC transporter ATP-binding protein [Candidatus Hydrogenedens sp.]